MLFQLDAYEDNMTAHKKHKVEIVSTRRRIGPDPEPDPTSGSNKDIALDVKFYSNANRQMRYQYLPDHDSTENDEQIWDKLLERFEIMNEMTIEAAEGRCRGLTISGPGGVGKTFEVDRTIKEIDPTGERCASRSGYSTPVGLVKLLYQFRNEEDVLKLDDIDSIYSDEKALNFLKIATDTTQTRIISYETNGSIIAHDGDLLPQTFEFHGSLIYCTNLDFDALIDRGSRLAPHLDALMTRSHYIDLGMRTKRDYLIRVFQVSDMGLFENVQGGALDDIEKKEVLEFIDKYHRNLRECSLRMALKIGALRKAWRPDDKHSWQRKALLTCCKGVR
jgi:hypothetical protein